MTETLHILVLQGPNLNLLGLREPKMYGSLSLKRLCEDLDRVAAEMCVKLTHKQSNHEGELVDIIQAFSASGGDGAVINAGAYTHTSIAIRDALSGTELPFSEVHISNVHAREPFRHKSYLSDIAEGVVVGFGVYGYELGLSGIVCKLRAKSSSKL